MASHPVLQEADLITYAPNGMRDAAIILAFELRKPVAHARKHRRGDRITVTPASDEDRELMWSALRPRIVEDVVTTLGTVAAVAGIFDPVSQDIASLAYLRRGRVDPANRQNLVDHYLVERDIPTGKYTFRAQLEEWERDIYKPRKLAVK
jgi:hypothetical protein